MSSKGRQAVRMSNQIEKANRLNIEAIEDPTLINYLRLAEVILEKNPRKMSYYLTDLENKEEADKRMARIDYLRKIGAGTKLDHEEWMKKLKKDNKQSKEKFKSVKLKVINPATGTKETFNTLKEACDEYGLKTKNVSSAFSVKKSNKIKYKGLILEKL